MNEKKNMDQSGAEVIRPGVVVLRGVLDKGQQLRIIDIVKRHGGLKTEDGAWNFFGKRGRTFDALKNYPPQDEAFIRECFLRMRMAAEEAGGEIPIVGCTHILTWWYPDQKGMGWHTDGYGGNDGDKDAPVYSLTVGNSCVFEWRPVGDDANKESATIHSGDVIVFGGPQRMMMHRVRKVLRGTFEADKEFDVRINITFRKLDNFSAEQEHLFQTTAYEQRMKEEFEKRGK